MNKTEQNWYVLKLGWTDSSIYMSKSVGASERPENQPALPEGISVHLSLGRHPGRTLKRELPTPGAPRTEFTLQRVPLTPWPCPPRECSGPERPGSLPGSPRANANQGGPAHPKVTDEIYTGGAALSTVLCVLCFHCTDSAKSGRGSSRSPVVP